MMYYYLNGISGMSTRDVMRVISDVLAAMLRKRLVSEDKIAEFTDKIKEKPMGQLFEHWDNGPDLALIEKGRIQGSEEERKNTEAERKRADAAERRAYSAEAELAQYKALYGALPEG
jgi:hypothetical protein